MDLHERVRLAGMIYVMRTVTKLAPVQTPSFIDPTNPKTSAACPAARFCGGDELPGIFGYLSAPLEAGRGKTTLPLY